MKNLSKHFFIIVFFVLIGGYIQVDAQSYFGFKAGANTTKISYDSDVYKKFYDTKFSPGYTVGAVFLMKNKELFGFYTEFLYSVKGKNVKSRANDYNTNIAKMQYLDLPVMFRVNFSEQKFGWFLQIGPELNYWLGGRGAFEVYEPNRDIFTRYEYKINFGEPKNTVDYLNVEDANRFQIGFAFGAGFTWDLQNANYIALDLRYSLGNTFHGGYETASIPNIGLEDNFEYTNNTISVSAVYYFNIIEKAKLSKNQYRKR